MSDNLTSFGPTRGMFNCPICFYDKPHSHSDSEVKKYRKCEREGSHAQPYEDYTPVSEASKYCRMVPGRSFTPWSVTDSPHEKLQPRRAYKIVRYEVHTWHTRVYLDGVEGCFNNLDLAEITSPYPEWERAIAEAASRG